MALMFKILGWPGRFLIFLAACLTGAPIHGAIAPYTVDSSTLHLWPFDESATPCVDFAPGGTNLGNPSYSSNAVSFSNCISFGTLAAPNAIIFPIGSGAVGTPIPFTYA